MSDSTEDISLVRGHNFFDKPFINNILSTNIAVYKHLAKEFFDGDMERVVWASIDSMFRRRQTQLATRKNYKSKEPDLGLLDFPFCAFRLVQDGVQIKTSRNWWNPSLHVKGIWIEELKKRIRITPLTLNYEACFCCSHDTDLYMMQQNQIWTGNAETLLESFIDITDLNNKTHTLKNIIVYDVTPKMNTSYVEKDWLEKNKIQVITMDIACQTWTITEDIQHKYSVTRKFLFDFINGANYHQSSKKEIDMNNAEQILRNIFINNSP